MSTANKLTYLNDTKQLLKQKINNLGGDITDNTTFRQYANQLQTIYDNAPKTDYEEGSNITLSNTLKGKLDFEDGIVGYGQTEQYTTNGYQLFNPTETWSNFNGITTTITNQVMKWNGTVTTNGSKKVANISMPSGTYTISFKTISGSHTSGKNIWLDFLNGTTKIGGTNFWQDGNKQVTLNGDVNIVNFGFDSGDVFNNYSFIVMIESGSTAHEWEPYTNGASPNPSYPQDIEVVRGKNLFDGVIERGSIVSGQNINNGTAPNWRSTNYIKVSPNTGYAFSVNSIINRIVVSFYTSNKTWINRDSETQGTISANGLFTTPSNCEYIRFRSYLDDFNLFENGNIMLEKGSQATSYLPYNTLEVVERGKNLANIGNVVEGYISGADGSIVSSSTNNEGTIAFIKVKPNTAYTFKIFETSWASFGTSNWFAFAQFTTNNTSGFISRTTSSSSSQDYFTITTSSTTQYVSISARGLLSATRVQLEENNQATTYEPYQTPQTYQLSLGDKELYTDSKIVRVSKNNFKFVDKWKKIFIDSNDIASVSKGCGIFHNKYFIDVADVGINSYNIIPPILSNIDKSEKWNYINDNDDLGGKMFLLKLTESQNQFRLYLNATTVQEAKTNLDNSNAYFIYKAITPIETPITDTILINQLENFYNSHSFTGTTIIEINGQLPLIIKVRALKGE